MVLLIPCAGYGHADGGHILRSANVRPHPPLCLDGPLDSFYYLRVEIAVIVGVILSSPCWLYQVWAFVAPGPYAREALGPGAHG